MLEFKASSAGVLLRTPPQKDTSTTVAVKIQEHLLRPLFALLILGSLFYLLELIAGRSLKQRVFRKGYWTDVLYFLSAPAVKVAVKASMLLPASLLILLNLSTPQELKEGLYHGYGPLSRQPVWAQVIQIYLLVDFCGYWVHRLFHTGKWWPFHAVHHSSEHVDWLASVRVHPINELVDRLAQASPVLLLGFNPTLTLASAPILTLYAITLHANLNWDYGPFRGWIASPVFHRWHHSNHPEALNKNFAGLLPIWDILFKTYYMPKGVYPERFGINEPMPSGFLAQWRHPFTGSKNP